MITPYSIYDSVSCHLQSFDLEWLPPWAYEYVTPSTSRDGRRIELRAGPYVGALPLLNGDVLWILPRAGQRAFSRMLILSEGLEDSIHDGYLEEAAIGAVDGESSLVALLARPFLSRLMSIEKNSLEPGREMISAQTQYARGTVNALRTELALATGEFFPVYCTYWSKTYNTAEHRVLGAAAMQLLHVGKVQPEYLDVADRWANFVKVKRIRTEEIRTVVSGLSQGKYSGYRSYYISALLMARLILSHADVSFSEHNIIHSESMLTNMPLLFERYVRNIFSKTLSSSGYMVEKTNGGPRSKRLFIDGTGELFPDILVSQNGQVCLVADAKYKPGREAEAPNYYQMSTYLRAYNCKKGMLVLPAASNTSGKSSSMRRTFWDGYELTEIRLQLERPEEAELFLHNFLLTLLG